MTDLDFAIDTVTFPDTAGGDFVEITSELFPEVMGHGKTETAALRDWENQLKLIHIPSPFGEVTIH